MAKTVPEICYEFQRRQTERGPLFEQCRRITQAYNNEIALPLPEISAEEAPAVANLISAGIDQHAMRIASVLPDVQCPPLEIGKKASEVRADKRRRACLGYWEANTYNLLVRRRARSLIAYTQSPVFLGPDKKLGQPRWEVRAPTETYPSDLEVGQMQPDDTIFAFTRTVGWLHNNYPEIDTTQVTLPGASTFAQRRPLSETDPIDLVKWIDGTEIVVVAVGVGETPDVGYEAEYGIQDARIVNLGPSGDSGGRQWAVQLLRIPNRLEMCPVVVPGRINLAGLRGQFDDSIGLAQMQAKLMAMLVNAIANGIWPDQWMINAPNSSAKIITQADGRRGIVGQIEGAASLETTQIQPGQQTTDAIDRLERAQRLSGSVPANFGGEAASNIRTAVQSNAVLGDAVDFTIQEHQEILAQSMKHELEIASKIDTVYFGSQKKSFYVSWKGGKGRLDYTPKDIWTEDRTIRVSYAKAGSDINALDVEIGQKVGIGTMSKLTGMRIDPTITDPEEEHGQVLYEALEGAMLSGIQQQAASGSLPLSDLAAIMGAVRGNDPASLVDAVTAAQQAAQQRQSSTVAPAEPGSPEAQPGLSPPGAGAEAGGPIAPPTPSAANLVSLLRGLRTGGQVAAQGAPGPSAQVAATGAP